MAIAITYKEPRLYQILAQPNVLSNENVGSIYEVAKENDLEAVSKVCFNYLNKYFNTIVRDKNVVAKWSAGFVAELLAQFEAGTSKDYMRGIINCFFYGNIMLLNLEANIAKLNIFSDVELARHFVAGAQPRHDGSPKQSGHATLAKHQRRQRSSNFDRCASLRS